MSSGPGAFQSIRSSRYGSLQLQPTFTPSCKRSTPGAKEGSSRKIGRKKRRRKEEKNEEKEEKRTKELHRC